MSWTGYRSGAYLTCSEVATYSFYQSPRVLEFVEKLEMLDRAILQGR
ncbi:hypothetical protein LBWT_Y0160 (plasmid) [Leptolyngbya boryana IAM M-101]|nr:hypothetical protein LBWT_Y0160 [Leptolyngbya boryana IAM M-101]BAS66776.1 hypothetical protein LBDG_Y0160 [Leptolyngbya boryana dg5]